MNRLRKTSILTVIGFGVLPYVAKAVPMVYIDETSYLAAITAIDPGAVFGLEDFNSAAVGDLGVGPTAFTGFDLTLNAIGSNGSFTGIINPGEFNGDNALGARVVEDTADFDFFGALVMGEGVESMDFAFSAAVIGFAAQWNSTTGNNGVNIFVNGETIALGDFLPNNSTSGGLNDGDGFLGIVDAALIGSFSLLPGTLSIPDTFEDFELDDLQFATPIPAPGALLLGMIGFGLVGSIKRWMV